MNALYENLRMALDSLRANKMRSLLTTLGIIIGIMTVIAIISVIQGLNLAFANELFDSGLGGGVLYVQKFPWASQDWAKYRNYKDLGYKEYQALSEQAKSISHVAPVLHTAQTVKFGGKQMKLVLVTGSDADYQIIRNILPAAGRILSENDVSRNRNVVVVGWEVAETLFQDQNPIGQLIRVGPTAFRVIGVLEKRGSFFDQNLDQLVIIPYGAFEKSFGSRRSISIMAKVSDPQRMEEAIDEVRGIMRRVRKVPFESEDDFAINQIDVLRDLYDKLTGSLYAAMFGVAAISLLVGGIGIMNIMLVSVIERTREIGIRKSLGARRRDILTQFMIEALVLSAVGGVIGILAGFGIAKLVATLTPVPAAVKWWSVFLGLGFSTATGIGFGIFPAIKAARKHPVEALSYE